MTCIVGVIDRENDRVYIGGDSAGTDDENNLQIRKDHKVFINGEFIIGFTSSYRMGQILMFNKLVTRKQNKNELDFEYLVQEFIPTIIKLFVDNKWAVDDRGNLEGGRFIMGYRKKLYQIQSNFQVSELSTDYDSVGCGERYALGSLYTSKDMLLPIIERITIALDAASNHNSGVKGPYIIKWI